MSLAQRRTHLDGIEPFSDSVLETTILQGDSTADGSTDFYDIDSERRASTISDSHRAGIVGIPVEDGKEVWQELSYDAFHAPRGPEEVLHYEPFPPEIGDSVAAYEVSTARRIAQIGFAVVACVLASGIVCGFAALKPILISEGVYSSLCPPDWAEFKTTGEKGESKIPCPEQDMRLNLFYITASITLNISTVLAGYMLDHYGRRACYLSSAAILLLGSGCMSFAFWLGERMTWFDGYIAGNVLLGLGGNFLFVSSYQLSNAFPRHAGLVVALVTGAFDASAAVFLFYRLAYEATNRQFKPATFFIIFGLTIPALILIAEITLMPKSGYNTKREYQAAIAAAQDPSQDLRSSDQDLYRNKPQELRRARERRASIRETQLERIETVTGTAEERREERKAARERQATSGVYGILQTQSVARQMATPWFWLLLLMTIAQMTRMNYFIATVRAQYRYMLGGSDALAERVNAVFDVALPVAGVVTTPFIGVLLNEVPVWGTLAVLTALIVALGALNCVSGSLGAGYATVVMFVLFRPLYYSAVSDYATKVFGFATFGRIYGTIICVSGIGQFIQPALDTLTHGPLHNNPVPLNLAFGISGSVLCAALTLFVYAKTRENGERTEELVASLEAEQAGADERVGLLTGEIVGRGGGGDDDDDGSSGQAGGYGGT
ncbi:major facilitator superfamily domain-containing protein [Coniella lustricola]|uniref:Major facilitator superfamily domain-containing protein n=1 Tax=Coniella lustricola TaxID=2025994 RepID=A0A2T3A1N7_9PEZI|nr:major facilitator superfamily domain-containing protein [Coniella lustricola]